MRRRSVPAAGSAGVAVVVSAGVAAATWAARGRAPGAAASWERTNHAGGRVSLVEGPAWALGSLAGVLATPGVDPLVRVGTVLATTGAAAAGLVDDLAGTGHDKGLRGHLGALRHGRLTTGGLKVLAIGASGLAAAWPLLAPDRRARRRPRTAGAAPVVADLADVAVAGALVAGTANLANLLDLRPGRVLKLVLLAVLAGAVPPTGVAGTSGALLRAAAGGASLALLPADLGERAMLGDCGANAAGALLGSSLVASTGGRPGGRWVRGAALGVVVVLTLASERVSFTRVIESTPGLRELDGLGRRPAAPAARPG